MNQLQADQAKPESCPSWGGCAAPLCPHDPQSLERGSWFPDEGICQSRKLAAEHRKWVRRQRRIAQVSKNRDRYFTYADLTRLRRVTSAVGDTQGHNPDVATLGKAAIGG